MLETTLTKEQNGKYVNVTYNHNLDKVSFNLKYNATQCCLSETDADTFIERTKQIEAIVEQNNVSQGSIYKTPLIILKYLPVIESISSGIDVRSKMSDESVAKMVFDSYVKKYSEAQTFCNETINMFESTGKKEGYGKRYKDYDKHNELVSEFQLGLRTFKMDDFDTGFHTMNKSLDEILQMLKLDNSEK